MNKVILLLLFFSSLSEGRILIQAPGADSDAFLKHLRNYGGTSLSEYNADRIRRNSRQEERLFAFADLPANETARALKAIADLRSEGPLSELSLRFVTDLSTRWLSQTNSSQVAKEVRQLHCETSLLLRMQPKDCAVRMQSLSELHHKALGFNLLMVEGVGYFLDSEGHFPSMENSRYHFTLLSNSYRPIHFYGTYEELMQQKLPAEPMIRGTCLAFTSDMEDISLQMQASAYFSEVCIKALHEIPTPQASGWLERNRKWVYPTAALLLGAGAYALKDKKIIIEAP